MSLYAQYATDKKAEKQGVWVDFGQNEDGSVIKFKISRMSKTNKKYTKRLEAQTKPFRRAIELETMDDALAEKIFMEVFVDTILLDWQNVNDRDGKPLKFSKENAMKLLEELTDLYEDLQEKAKKASLFREEALDEEAKN